MEPASRRLSPNKPSPTQPLSLQPPGSAEPQLGVLRTRPSPNKQPKALDCCQHYSSLARTECACQPSQQALLTSHFPPPPPTRVPTGHRIPRATLRMAPTPESIPSIPSIGSMRSIQSIRSTRLPKPLPPSRPLIHSAPPSARHELRLKPLADRQQPCDSRRPVRRPFPPLRPPQKNPNGPTHRLTSLPSAPSPSILTNTSSRVRAGLSPGTANARPPHLLHAAHWTSHTPGFETVIISNAKTPWEAVANSVGSDIVSRMRPYPLNFRQLEENDTRPNAPFADGYSTRYREKMNCSLQK